MKKADWLVIVMTAVLSVLPLLPLVGEKKADTVTVSSHGETVYTGALTKDAVIDLPGNTISVKDGAVTMLSADCPDGTCMKSGRATASHPIVCLPNEVIVTVTGEGEPELDGVSY